MLRSQQSIVALLSGVMASTLTFSDIWTLDKKDCVRVRLTRTQVKLGRRAKTHPCNVKKGKLEWYRLQRVGVIVAFKIG